MTDRVRVVCDDCDTRTVVEFTRASEVIETHNEKRHGGDEVAGVELYDEENGKRIVAPSPEKIKELYESGGVDVRGGE